MVKKDDTTAEDVLNGSNTLPAMIPISDGVEVQLGAVVAAAHTASGHSVEEWNALPQEERDIFLNMTIEKMKADAAGEAPKDETPPEPPKDETPAEPAKAPDPVMPEVKFTPVLDEETPAPAAPAEPTELAKLVKDLEKAFGISRDKSVNRILERALETANKLLADEQAND